ncbi:MAG: STAS domain-containing protein [Bacteroidales bacterium]|nr:STAS domain-containing protein [Bacteroidales bacterium]
MEVKINIQDNLLIAQFIGMLDTPATEIVQPKVDEIIANADKNIRIDFKELTYIASAGIRQILSIRKAVAASGSELIIDNIQPAVFKVFKVTNLDKILKMENVIEN